MRYSLLICMILMLGCARANAMDKTGVEPSDPFNFSKIADDLMKSYDIVDMKISMFSEQNTVCRFLKMSFFEIEVVSRLIDFGGDDLQGTQNAKQYQQYFLNRKIQFDERTSLSMGVGAVLSFKTDESMRNLLANNASVIEKTGVPVMMSQISFNTTQPISEHSTINFGIKVVKDFDAFGSKKGMYQKSMSESQLSLEYVLTF